MWCYISVVKIHIQFFWGRLDTNLLMSNLFISMVGTSKHKIKILVPWLINGFTIFFSRLFFEYTCVPIYTQLVKCYKMTIFGVQRIYTTSSSLKLFETSPFVFKVMLRPGDFPLRFKSLMEKNIVYGRCVPNYIIFQQK